MNFEPVNEEHSIVEVAFALQLSTEFTFDDVKTIKSSHHLWTEFLPRMHESEVVQFAPVNELSYSQKQMDTSPAPFSFVRYMLNGFPEWELSFVFKEITLKCFFYSQWSAVKKNIIKVFNDVAYVLQNNEQYINSITLQYTDVFNWTGNIDDYDNRKLLNEDSLFVPNTIIDCGPFWHLHQGWFSEVDDPIIGRVLTRIHIDATNENNMFVARFENLNRFDAYSSSNRLALNPNLVKKGEDVDTILEFLHCENKKTLGSILHKDIQRRIKLYGNA